MRKRRRNRNIGKHEKCVNKNVVGRTRKEYYKDNQERLLPEERNKEQTTLKSTKKRTGNIKKTKAENKGETKKRYQENSEATNEKNRCGYQKIRIRFWHNKRNLFTANMVLHISELKNIKNR